MSTIHNISPVPQPVGESGAMVAPDGHLDEVVPTADDRARASRGELHIQTDAKRTTRKEDS